MEKSVLAGAYDVSNGPYLGKNSTGTQWEIEYFSLSGVLVVQKGGLEKVGLGARLQRSLGTG